MAATHHNEDVWITTQEIGRPLVDDSGHLRFKLTQPPSERRHKVKLMASSLNRKSEQNSMHNH